MDPSSFCPLDNQRWHIGQPIFEQLELVLDPIPVIDIIRMKPGRFSYEKVLTEELIQRI